MTGSGEQRNELLTTTGEQVKGAEKGWDQLRTAVTVRSLFAHTRNDKAAHVGGSFLAPVAVSIDTA